MIGNGSVLRTAVLSFYISNEGGVCWRMVTSGTADSAEDGYAGTAARDEGRR